MQVENKAFFNYTVFNESVSFGASQFMSAADFINTTFNKTADFENTYFLNTVRVEDIQSAKELLFTNTHFGMEKPIIKYINQ